MRVQPFENIFVLCTGRCGSTTFVQAARHATNFTASHESRSHLTGDLRLAYPANHIEADNRLTWLLGRLDATWGTRPLYVHLRRDAEETAQSFAKRANHGILLAYRTAILMGAAKRNKSTEMIDFCRDYVHTVEQNIALFLRDKPQVMQVTLENAQTDFPNFWDRIGAEGDLNAAMAEWTVKHNASKSP